MKVVLINSPLVGYRGDPFGHIPSIPIGLLYVAAAARDAGHEVTVIDAFGLAPSSRRSWFGDFELAGLGPEETASLVGKDADVIGVSTHSGASHRFTTLLLGLLKDRGARLVVGGPFASTLPGLFIEAGADCVVVGEGEDIFCRLLERLDDPASVAGVVTASGEAARTGYIEDLDALPYPAYDLIDLSPYFEAGRAHGPWQGPYLPLITSRGCPYNCAFCATPMLSSRKWRARSAKSVVAEIEAMGGRYGVSDFHIQDDNFTTSPGRVEEICAGLRGLGKPINFCLPSAVKVENVSGKLLDVMAAAGLRYIAFSPESGSAAVLELMNKQVDLDRLVELISHAARLGLASQACFVLGFPGEADVDRGRTRALMRRLVRAGVDDVSFFIMSPVPGSASEGSLGPAPSYEGFNWSPRWRPDYRKLNRFRGLCYAEFFLKKLAYHPARSARFFAGAVRGRYRTKGEMTIGHLLRTRLLR